MHDVYFKVQCEMLAPPMNGDVMCLRTSDMLSYEDTCSFTCNTGYELTGSDTRTCQIDGSWNGSDTMCIIRGIICMCFMHDESYIPTLHLDTYVYPLRLICILAYLLLTYYKQIKKHW